MEKHRLEKKDIRCSGFQKQKNAIARKISTNFDYKHIFLVCVRTSYNN